MMPNYAAGGKQMEGTLSVREAAERLGVSKDTIRRRIKSGDLAAVQEPTAQGFEWRIVLDEERTAELCNTSAQLGSNDPQLGSNDAQVYSSAAEVSSDTRQAPADTDEGLEKALQLVEKVQQDYAAIHRENLELAARCGYLQARLEASEKQLLALSAPAETEEERRRAVPWWKRLLGLAPAG